MIKTETVVLLEETQTGTDGFGQPVYSTTEAAVPGVVVGSPSTDDVLNDLNITGKQLLFTLGIPKTDTHDWKDKTIKIRGQLFRTYGFPIVQTAENVPGPWNTQVKVCAYE